MSLQEQLGQPPKQRPIHTFTFPKALQDQHGVQSVGLRELTVEEDLMAIARSQVGGTMVSARVAYERVKAALAEVNGAPVSLGDGTADKAFAEFPQPIRELVGAAYAKVSTVEEDLADAFLKSQQVRVG